ncbi:CdaR family transcriptional regulator [Ornithinibacillus xuwenensis]|uniref:Sugar diacid recognition domain-containing protein n=1 Tax=Ornithinibacillus xuwenensis TaxID=3144668 RepID=A0ABU9XHM0_9BACI
MELTRELGKKIINETRKLIDENIIIVNKNAIIIASTDPTRIDKFHEGAQMTIQNNSVTLLTEDHIQTMKGIRPGVNLPISINNTVIGVIGITGNPQEIIPFASLMQKMTELLIQENIYIQENEWHARALETYFLEWIQMDDIPNEFLHRGELLGITLSPPFRCSIVSLNGNHIQAKTVDDVLKLFRLKLNCPVIRWGNSRLILITEEVHPQAIVNLQHQLQSAQNYIQSTLHVSFSIGIGTSINTYQIKESFQKANKALSIGRENNMTYYEDLLLEVCLDDIKTDIRHEFLDKIISKFKNEDALMNTLKIYLKNNMNLTETATELHIHINTLHYRLNRIKQLTGLNPKHTYSIALFYTAFYFLDNYTK